MSKMQDLRAELVALVDVDYKYPNISPNPETPCAQIGFPTIDWKQGDYSGVMKTYRFPLWLYVSANDVDQAQEELADLIESLSAIDGASGSWWRIQLEETLPMEAVSMGNREFLRAETTVEIEA